MSNRSYRSLIEIGQQAQGPLQRIQQQLEQLLQLQHALQQILPLSQKNACQVAGLKGCTLLLTASTQAWATKLRFQLPQLLSSLRQAGFPWLAQLRLTAVKTEIPKPQPRAQVAIRPVSLKNRNELRQLAQQVTDPQLQAALERLVRRLELSATRQ